MDWYIPFIIFAAIFGLIWYLARFYEQKRTKKLETFALTAGFNFSAKGDDALLASFSEFPLFSVGRSKRLTNLLQGRQGDAEVSIFDYKYTVGGGQNSRQYRQTVICFRSDRLKLPAFTLRPENIFHKIGTAFGYQDVDFEHSPEFSKDYLLRGRDEQAIRSAFNAGVLAYYTVNKGLCTEGEGDRLIYYRSGKRVKLENLPTFVEEGREVYQQFHRR